MHVDNYTPEAVCGALGLPGFQADGRLHLADAAVRLLIQPSFHPEICVTVLRTGNAARVEVAAASKMVWRPGPMMPVPTAHATGALPAADADRLLGAAVSPHAVPQGVAVIDGMPVSIVVIRRGHDAVVHETNVSLPTTLSDLAADAIHTAWTAVDDPFIRNALAAAGGYCGLSLPQLAAGEPPIRLAVLGETAEREELVAALAGRIGAETHFPCRICGGAQTVAARLGALETWRCGGCGAEDTVHLAFDLQGPTVAPAYLAWMRWLSRPTDDEVARARELLPAAPITPASAMRSYKGRGDIPLGLLTERRLEDLRIALAAPTIRVGWPDH